MITLGLLSVLLLAGLGLLLLLLARVWTLEVAFGLPVLTCIASPFLASIGATLVAAARERREGRRHLVRATLVASLPGGLLAAFLLYAFLTYALGTD